MVYIIIFFLDTILALLLEDQSEEENSSGSEPEDHIEADLTYETEGEDEVSALNEEQLPDQDNEASNDTSSTRSIEDVIPSTSADPSDLIIRPSRNILRWKKSFRSTSMLFMFHY